MHLKALTIKGFKSFADKTTLKFEPGITAIVGPNGSGKSNITDAVLWVLGEQSPRSLRGSEMEDIIFSGSPARPCAGLAEVSLFLDNSDGVLPIEFSEVSLTRRISRSGESEYLINNSPCRLLDVQDLLHDSGLGKEMYSIISQGRLEQILTSRPEERGLLIEEAAGVLKHKRRKERALRKLTSMEQNLIRAKDVLKEINRQLQPLERQARKAQDYRKLLAQLRDLELSSYVKQLQELKNDWGELSSKESNLEKDLQDLKEKISGSEEETEDLRVQIEDKQTRLMTLGEQKRSLQIYEDRVNNSSLLLLEKKKTLVLREQELRQKIQQLEQRVIKREKESVSLNEEKNLILARKENIWQKICNLQNELEEKEKEEQNLIEELDRLKKKISKEEEIQTTKQEKLNSFNSNISNQQLRVEFLENQINTCSSKIKAHCETLSKIKEEYLKLQSRCANLGKESQVLREKIECENKALNKIKLEHEKIKEKLAASQAEQKAFNNLKAVLSEFSGLEVVRQAKISGILGVLGELIQVPKKHEKAVEAVLGTDLLCLLTETIQDAEQVLSFLQKEKIARVSMLPASGISRKSRQISLGENFIPAFSVIKCDERIKGAIESLLAGVFIVPDLKRAFEFLKRKDNENNGYILVTECGKVIHSSGKIDVGSHDKPLKILRREREREFQLEEKRYLDGLKGLEEEISCKLKEISALSEDLTFLTRELKEKEFAIQNLNADKKRIENEVSNMESQRKTLGEDIEGCKSKIEAEHINVKGLNEEMAEVANNLELLRNHRAELIRAKDANFEQRKETEQEIIKCKLEISATEEKENYLAKRTGLISEDRAELRMLLDSEECTRKTFNEFANRLRPLHSAFNELLEATRDLAKEVNSRIYLEENSLKESKDKLSIEKGEALSLSEQVGKLLEKVQNIRVAKAQLEVQVKSISQKIVDEYEISLDKAINEYQTDLTADDLEVKVSELKRKIENLGPVNPIAIEEFNELEEREKFLTSQISDLIESRQALEKVTRAIDKKIKDQFLHTFQEVNFHFQSVFSYLFEGGEAELILNEPDDPLNSGISFNVHPSGKRLQKVTLLSGGEAALVALTFLFAIYHTRPSPFYILDEVEPALDSMNLQRFATFLKVQSKKTQFLIITHQKRTMEIADLLYGISMTPEGISSVISQKLTEFQEVQNGQVYAT